MARGAGFSLTLGRSRARLALSGGADVSLSVVGGREARYIGEEPLPGRSHYFLGPRAARRFRDVPNFRRAVARGVKPGVDLVFHGRDGRLEYDLVVAPGADPETIALRLDGASDLHREGGALVAGTASGPLRFEPPVAFQERGGARRSVASRYRLNADGTFGFDVGAYDRSAPLVIDPILVFSTYLGGAGTDSANAIALDVAGNVYVAGETTSLDFPVSPGAALGTNAGASDAFVFALDPTGATRLFATYLGGAGDDFANAVAVDASGRVSLAGETTSSDFPTTPGARQTAWGGSSDAFVAALAPGGGALVFSTYHGGSGQDRAAGVAIGPGGAVTIAGRTGSTDLPVTAGAFQTAFLGGDFDAFVARFQPSGAAFAFSTYLGGVENDNAFGLALDAAGNAYVAGGTRSPDFPVTLSAYQGTNFSTDAFLSKLNAAGNALVYSTFLGGSFVDRANGLAVDAAGRAYVVGQTVSPDFPIANAFQATFGGGANDAFVATIDPAASGAGSLLFSTFLGGGADDRGIAVAVDPAGRAHVAGQTASASFPLLQPTQPTFGGAPWDAFVATLAPSGASLVFSTFLGGGGEDRALAVATDGSGDSWVAGRTESTSFPTARPYQATAPLGMNAFVARLGLGQPAAGAEIPALSRVALAALAAALAGAAFTALGRAAPR